MKIPAISSCHPARFWVLFALAPLSFVPAFAAAPEPSVAADPAPKTHVLFMGADLSLEQNRKFYPLEAVTATALVIKPGDKPVKVPLEQSVNLLIHDSLKIATTSVEINQLKFERAYAVGSDPFDQLARSAALAADTTALADIARGEALRANMAVAAASGSSAADRANAETQRTQAEGAFTRALDAPTSQVYDVGGQSVRASGEEMFDAIRITFRVTPETDLQQAYVGVIAQFRERGNKSGRARQSAYVQPLGSMSAGVSRKVLVYRGGFPPGYILEGCDVHFYRGSEELATNLSHKRVLLTDDEALEYRIIEYVDDNKGRTLPATPATTALPAAMRERLTLTQLNETWYVRVARDGRVIAVFRDAVGKQPAADPALESALKTLRFKPALTAGKPVESIVPLNPGQLN